jgi:hypothetical protein
MAKAAVDPKVGGRVDHRLDPQRPAPLCGIACCGVLVADVDGGLHPAGDDPGGKAAVGVGVDAPVEDQRALVGAADLQVVGDQGFKQHPGVAGAATTRVQATSTCRIDSSHQDPAARSASVSGSGRRPATLEDHPDGARPEPVTAGLRRPRLVAGGEPVGQVGAPDALPAGLLLGPLVPIDHTLIGQGK